MEAARPPGNLKEAIDRKVMPIFEHRRPCVMAKGTDPSGVVQGPQGVGGAPGKTVAG
jgi:hypothetical protein